MAAAGRDRRAPVKLCETPRKITIKMHIMTVKCEIGTQSVAQAFHKIPTR
jgi:hypothetical protein